MMTVGAVVLVGLLALGGVALWRARSAADQVVDGTDASAEAALLDARAKLAWVHHDLLVDSLVAELGGPPIDDDRLDRFHDRRDATLDTVERLADGDTDVSDMAAQLLDALPDEPFDQWPYPADELDRQHYMGLSAGTNGDPVYEFESEGIAIYRTLLPSLVVLDAAAVDLTTRNRVPGWARSYVDFGYEVADETPGWLGPDRTNPFDDHVLSMGPADSSPIDAPPIDTLPIDTMPELRRVWDYDQWLIQRVEAGPAGRAPSSVVDVAMAARTVTIETRAQAARQLAALAAEADAEEAVTSPTVWLIAAGGAFGGAIATLLLLLGGSRRRKRAIEDELQTDHLTGAKNRRYLETVVAGRLSAANRHHLVAMIDLDRFKLVNDTWGHDAGDALLIATAQRLTAAVEMIGTGRANFVGAVMRQGGDEFVVALHSTEPFDPGTVENQLAAIAGPVEVGTDEPVMLELSVGVATTMGSVELSDLLKPADLATYERKRSRAGSRQATATGDYEPSGQVADLSELG